MPVTPISNFRTWTHLGLDGKLVSTKPKTIQFLTFSNGLPCYEANAYINSLIHRPLASKTIRTYAYSIIHLVRYVEQHKSIERFDQLCNVSFSEFVANLQYERNNLSENARANNTVRSIAHRCLDFLQFIAGSFDIPDFIGKGENSSINIIEKEHQNGGRKKKGYKKGRYITHSSIPSLDEIKSRHPVSSADALKVWNHISGLKSKDKRKRNKAIYIAMEQLGARVEEIHLITYSSFKEAQRTKKLKVDSLKKRKNAVRYIPISALFLSIIADYIKVRKRIMSAKKLQHDFLFVSLTTGKPYNSGSWTTVINSFKSELKIEGELSPHLWRHAFITDKLKDLILTSNAINSKDDFRKNLLHTETFKLQLIEWSGHSNVDSLETYIDLAFSDIYGYKQVYDAVSLRNSVSLAKRQITELKAQLKSKNITPKELVSKTEELLTALEQDIDTVEKSP